MLTFFTTTKPFNGHTAIIQRNAIQSWKELHPSCEVILLGNEDGTAKIASEFGLRHVPDVKCNEYGTPLVSDLFARAERIAHHDVLCYINADIILMSDFTDAVKQVVSRNKRFLMVGRRWNLDVTRPLDFDQDDWEKRLHKAVKNNGELFMHMGIDYFVFPRGMWGDIPPFAIGRPGWDNWMIYRARRLRASVIDATRAVTAVHQNHDYGHHPQGTEGVWKGPEAQENLKLAEKNLYNFSVYNATLMLTPHGFKPALTIPHLRRRLATAPMVYLPHWLHAPVNKIRRILTSPLRWLLDAIYRPAE
jgi:hypothetical protein